ncbi:snake venom serine protease KN11-like [Prorops nasuta]|uniref:snake venom serine protease KN11-like n=1 Tax=Prorops nasuta TaxID=863751 RepID=UPI0034CEE21A
MTHKNLLILIILLAEAVIGTLTIQYERLEHGTPALSNEFPFMAAILKKNNTFHCNAVLVSDKVLLTTASCLHFPKDDRPIIIRTGTNNILHGGETHKIKSTKILQKRVISKSHQNESKWYYDLGAIKLEKPIKINSKQRPINLTEIPPPELGIGLDRQKDSATIVAWGKGKDNKTDPDLQKVSAKLEANFFCKYLWNWKFHDHRLCGVRTPYREQKYFCTGNDGGAFIYKDALLAITSRGGGPLCNPGYLVTMNSIYHLKFFIDPILKED